jgi:hypothetical protein
VTDSAQQHWNQLHREARTMSSNSGVRHGRAAGLRASRARVHTFCDAMPLYSGHRDVKAQGDTEDERRCELGA